MTRRAVLLVLDGVGAGELPDAAQYGDAGSDTLGNLSRAVRLDLPHLARLGLSHAAALDGVPRPATPSAAWGRMTERSAGKDSVTGHWELAGVVLDRPFPTFPGGFPPGLIASFSERIGRPVLGNVVASGTEIIERLGDEHCATGAPIVYTSADSVFQIAAHEAVVPVAQLYEWCHVAFDVAVTGAGIGRVIARPFAGSPGAYRRTANRHDFAMAPTGETLLDRLAEVQIPVTSIGKVSDLFAGRGITTSVPTASDDAGIDALVAVLGERSRGLVFVNLVDFDTVYGHRNDVKGFARNLARFDTRLPSILRALTPDDLLIITADHGNDPTTPSTDHSREHVPLLVMGADTRAVPLGTRPTFADVGQTLAAYYGVGDLAHGTSFLADIGVAPGAPIARS